MQKNIRITKNTKKLITTPVPYATTFLLIALCFIPLTSAHVPQPGIHLITTGPTYAYAGDNVTYTYYVNNTQGIPLSNVTVTDDSCGPASYVSGDDNHNGILDASEVWIFTCTTTPDFTFPTPLTSTANATGTWEGQTAHDTAHDTLYPFILREAVLLYCGDNETINYTDPDTVFTFQMSKGEETLDTCSVSESTPMHLWLSQGTYRFTEINIPYGYLPANDTITYTTGETTPDVTASNIITFDLSVTKTGPETCYPNDQITYQYTVQNSGPASITPLLLDDRCGTPVYTGGDSDSDGRIDPSETWTYKATYTAKAEPGTIITNTVNVTDAEGANRSSEQSWRGGDANPSNNIAQWSVTVISTPEEPPNPPEPKEPPQPVKPTSHGSSNHYHDIAPVANASGPYNGVHNEEIPFNGSHSYDPDGFIIRYNWNFGDGSIGTGETTTHSYAQRGTYPVTLTVTDNFGVSDTNSTTATITVPNRPPSNPFIAGPMNGTINTDYTYIFGSTDEDHDDITYLINWGDGTSYQIGPFQSGVYFPLTHRWDSPRDYNITVIASDGTATASSGKHITIQETVIAENIAIIALAFLALLALIAVLRLIKKKKNSK